MSDFADRLNEAIALVNARRLDEAHALLLELSREQPDSEAVWLWLSATSSDTDERVMYLRRVLDINPANEKARAALLSLTGNPNLLPPIPPDWMVGLHEAVPTVSAGASPLGALSPKAGQGIEMTVLLLLAGLAVFVLVLLGGTALRPVLFPPTETMTPFPTRTLRPTIPTATPTFTITPGGPTLTPPGPTLPVTWTPAPSDTPIPSRTPAPTLTPRPTITPLPTRTPLPTYTPLPSDTPLPATPTETPTDKPTSTPGGEPS